MEKIRILIIEDSDVFYESLNDLLVHSLRNKQQKVKIKRASNFDSAKKEINELFSGKGTEIIFLDGNISEKQDNSITTETMPLVKNIHESSFDGLLVGMSIEDLSLIKLSRAGCTVVFEKLGIYKYIDEIFKLAEIKQ